jgi:hypothetical protein
MLSKPSVCAWTETDAACAFLGASQRGGLPHRTWASFWQGLRRAKTFARPSRPSPTQRPSRTPESEK